MRLNVCVHALQVLLYLPEHQQQHVLTLTEHVLKNGNIRCAMDYRLQSGPEGAVDLTEGEEPPTTTAGSWVHLNKDTVSDLWEKAGIMRTMKGGPGVHLLACHSMVLIATFSPPTLYRDDVLEM